MQLKLSITIIIVQKRKMVEYANSTDPNMVTHEFSYDDIAWMKLFSPFWNFKDYKNQIKLTEADLLLEQALSWGSVICLPVPYQKTFSMFNC